MNTLLEFLKEHADVIGLITATSGAVAGGLWGIYKHFKTKRGNISDLHISPFTGPNTKRLIPLDGHGVLEEKVNKQTVFKQGVKTEIVFSHNGKGKDVISVSRLELVVKNFEPDFLPEKDYKIDGNAIIGAGTGKANRFTVLVYGERVDRAVWIIDPKIGKTEQAKSENLLEVNAFNSKEDQYFYFNPQENKPELLQGTVLAEEPGLYEMQFIYYFRVGNKDRRSTSESFFIYSK